MTDFVKSTNEQAISDSIRESTDAMLDFLSRTVQKPSVTGHEDTVAELYAAFFASRGWSVEEHPLAESRVVRGERGSSEARTQERANVVGYYQRCRADIPTVVINGHIDVVPVLDGDQWSRDPFSGARVEGCVHGRGSVDTKGGIAAALWALDALDRAGVQLPFNVAVELVVGEETTGVGTSAALERMPARLGTIVLEPTAGAVVTVASGLLFFTVEVTGRAAHTSVPWHGIDVGPKLIDIYRALQDLGAERAARLTDPRMPFPSAVPLAIGTVDIGGWRAAVPARGSLSGRIGVMPGEDVSDVRAALTDCVQGVVARDEWLRNNPPVIRWDNEGLRSWETPESDPVVRALDEGRRRTGLAPKIEGMTAGCDAGILTAAGVSTAVFGPGEMRYAHSPDERIAERDVVDAALILANALAAWAEHHLRGTIS
ncbi:MAG: M20/M25/M40 family metallo-hydrolase [Mycolicibacterium neoaurum]|uniref:M20 family metallopeptidase n=1 Tax=Mycolicibacterium neoaurum TaxID=1795 RepID=UPI002FFBC74F